MAETALTVTNSVRPDAIGDALASFPAIHAAAPAAVYFTCAAIRPLFFPTLPDMREIVVFEDPPPGARVLDVQKFASGAEHRDLHLAQAWFEILGLPIPEMPLPIGHWPIVYDRTMTGPLAAVDVWLAPFSASDFGSGTKVWSGWAELVDRLHAKGLSVGLMCGKGEKPEGWRPDAYVSGLRLKAVCRILKEACCVVTVDNGVNWMCQAVAARHVLLQASNHGSHWTRDHGPAAVNIHSVTTATVDEVYGAVVKMLAKREKP